MCIRDRRYGIRVEPFPPALLSRLVDHAWPGNVRELSNVVERLVLLSEGGRVSEGDLPLPLGGKAPADAGWKLPPGGVSWEEHEKDAPTYNSEKSCIAKEGDGKCEHTAANGKYRPRLLAFLVTVSKTTKAKPLYAHPKGDSGFRDIGGSTYTTATEELVFSEHAQTMFEAHVGKKKGKH